MEIFNRKLLALRRDCMRLISSEINSVIMELYLAIIERFSAKFALALHIGSNEINLQDFLSTTSVSIDQLINVDIAYFPLKTVKGAKIVVDIENLPFKKNIFDLIISVGHLHCVNKIEKLLIDIKSILKPNGIFIATFPGGDTLIELRKSLIYAEEHAGVIARISPFIDVKDAGRLMQKAGFGLPVSESEIFNIKYKNIKKLFSDLKSLAETNILSSGIPAITKKTFDRMLNYYKNNFFDYEKEQYNVTLNMITITGIKEQE